MNIKDFNYKIENNEKIEINEAEKIFFNNKIDNLTLSIAAFKYYSYYFKDKIKFFYPGEKFPSISITGEFCELNCAHCNKRYLSNMIAISEENSLIDIALKLEKKGALGLLISGGCDQNGKIPINKFLNELKYIKSNTSLILNVHTGLTNKQTIESLRDLEIDVVSFDVICDNEIIRNILHLNKTLKDYYKILMQFKQSKYFSVVPHVCLGLNKGVIKNEFKAFKIIKEYNPKLIVIIIFTPTKGTLFENINSTPVNLINRFLSLTRLIFPKTELSLGCMRPRKKIKNEIEQAALNSGFNRIELPTIKSINFARDKKLNIKKYYGCCSLPENILPRFEFI